MAGSAGMEGPLAMPGYHTFFEIPPSASPGTYRIRGTARELTKRALVFATYTSSSAVRTAITGGQNSGRQGSAMGLSGMVFDGSKPLVGATAKVRIVNVEDPNGRAESLELAPLAGNEGIYVGGWKPAAAGTYAISMRTTGLSASGVPYARFAATEVRVEPARAAIQEITDSAVDDGGDGIPDRVVLECRVEAEVAGAYRLQMMLQASNRATLPLRVTTTLAKGATRVAVPVALESLAKLGVDGPYAIREVLLVYLGEREQPIADDRGDMGTTGAYPAGEMAGTPKAGVTAAPLSLGFGDVGVGTVKELAVTLTNAGGYPFTATQMRVSNAAFRIASAGPPIAVPGRGQAEVVVRFAPVAAGVQTGELLVAGLRIPMSGNGVGAAAGPRMEVSPAALRFGTVAVGQTRELGLTVRNTGNATLALSRVASTNVRFSVTPAPPVLIPAGGQQVMTVRFAPAEAGAQTGAVQFTSNETGRPAVEVTVEGTGTGTGGPQATVLQVDDGTAETSYGVAAGRDGYYVNRLTPATYPATLRRIQIFHPNDGPGVGSAFQLIAAVNTGGSGGLVAVTPRTAAARVTATGRFVEYDIEPITIPSGEFLAGFSVRGDGVLKPAAMDTSNYRERSFVSTNGVAFTVVDQVAGAPRGNFLVRGVIE